MKRIFALCLVLTLLAGCAPAPSAPSSGAPASSTGPGTPPSRWRDAPLWAPFGRVRISTRLTAAIAASASPRKPRVPMLPRSSAERSLEVAWRKKAVGSSTGAMPQPSSETRMRPIPPRRISTLTAVAPASMAFSTDRKSVV